MADYKNTYEYSELIMSCFVEIADELADSKGLKKIEFAQMIWPEATKTSNRHRWLAIRNVASKTGRPQGLQISEAYRISQALDISLAMLFLKAENLAEEKMKALQQKTD